MNIIDGMTMCSADEIRFTFVMLYNTIVYFRTRIFENGYLQRSFRFKDIIQKYIIYNDRHCKNDFTMPHDTPTKQQNLACTAVRDR